VYDGPNGERTTTELPHFTYSGAIIRLKGIARGDATEYYWDFGDGTSGPWTAIGNRYALEASHAYFGEPGRQFVAKLHVRNAVNDEDVDDYYVRIHESSDLSIPSHLDVRVHMAIDEGLWYLHKTLQRADYAAPPPGYGQPYGYWNDPTYGYHLAATGVCVDAFQLHGTDVGGNYDNDPYVETVQRGMNYILYNTYSFDITVPDTPAGNPDSNGNGIGLVANHSSSLTDSRQTYIGGICLAALASALTTNWQAPVGRNVYVYQQSLSAIVQDMVDFFAYGQEEVPPYRGGWRYYANYGESDMSTTQWPPLALDAAEQNMEASVPQFVRDELELFLDYTQYTSCPDNDHGGFGYQDNYTWLNCAKAAAGMICHEFRLGNSAVDDPRVQAAMGFLYWHWTDAGSSWDHQRLLGNSYSMYSVMKAMRVPEPDLQYIYQYDCTSQQQTADRFHWYYTPAGQVKTGLATYIVNTQQSDGQWDDVTPAPNAVRDAFATGWRILTLLPGVYVLKPVAVICECEFDVPQAAPGQPIPLDGGCSYHHDLNRRIETWEWDIDADGTFELTGLSVILPGFSSEGSYPVTLRVTDDNPVVPQIDETTCVVEVYAGQHPPIANANGDYFCYPDEDCWLDGTGSWDPDGDIVAYAWDCDGDGTYETAGAQAACTWPFPGVYAVGLRVTDSQPLSDTDYALVHIQENFAPSCDAGGPYFGGPNSTISLDAGGSHDDDPGDSIIEYAWDTDDDGTFELLGQRVPFQLGATVGTVYDICLRVMDNHENESICCTTAEIVELRGRVKAEQKGSLLIWPKVELRWNAAGELIQDTFIDVTNDYPDDVLVQLYFVNGDQPLAEDPVAGERAHPGCNWVDNLILLTADEPAYWSVAAGLPKGVSPFTVLDPGTPPGRPATDGSGQRVLRGYVLGWAVNSAGLPIRWNHLKGDALLVHYEEASAWEYSAYSCQTFLNEQGAAVSQDGQLRLDGVMYDIGFSRLLLDFYAEDSEPFSQPGLNVILQTDLTLLPLAIDLRQDHEEPVYTKAMFDVWNSNEIKFSGARFCLWCWDQRWLADIYPQHFLRANLQTDKGKTRIDGVASTDCPDSTDVSLLGVAAKLLYFEQVQERVRAGTHLTGQGEEAGLILYDVITQPEEFRMPGDAAQTAVPSGEDDQP